MPGQVPLRRGIIGTTRDIPGLTTGDSFPHLRFVRRAADNAAREHGMLTFIIWQLKGAGVRGGPIYGVTDEAKQAPGLPTVLKGTGNESD